MNKKIYTKKAHMCSECVRKITAVEFSAYGRMCYKCWRDRGGRL